MKCFLSIAVLLFPINYALGCSAIGYPDLPVNFIASNVEIVYLGRVISTTATIEEDDGEKSRVYRTKFKVEKAIKGVNGGFRQITIRTSLNNDFSCGYERPKFKTGEKWIIHENNYYKDIDKSRLLSMSPNFEEFWKYDSQANGKYFEILENAVKNPVTALYGQIQTHRSWESIENAEVIVEGNILKLSTRTDKNGKYSFENLPPGNYKIKIPMPYETQNSFVGDKAISGIQSKTYYFKREVTLKTGDADFYYIIINNFSDLFPKFFKFNKN